MGAIYTTNFRLSNREEIISTSSCERLSPSSRFKVDCNLAPAFKFINEDTIYRIFGSVDAIKKPDGGWQKPTELEIKRLLKEIPLSEISSYLEGRFCIFRVTSESPFMYFEPLTGAWETHIAKQFDATFLDDVPDGSGFEILKLDALKASHREGENRHRSELCTLFIRENKDRFKIQYPDVPSTLKRKDVRLTVDYPEDLILCRAVYEQFKEKAPQIPVGEILQFLDRNNQLLKLIAPYCEDGYATMYL